MNKRRLESLKKKERERVRKREEKKKERKGRGGWRPGAVEEERGQKTRKKKEEGKRQSVGDKKEIEILKKIECDT